MTQKKSKRGKQKKPPTPPQAKPWDMPPRPAVGDKEKDTLFAAVGSALTAWETLEESMAHIFSTLVSPNSDSLAALRSYGSIVSFRGRSEMIAAAANAAFFLSPNETLQKEIKTLVDEADGFAARRNEIAHGKAGTLYVPNVPLLAGTPRARSRPAGYVLGPPVYATNKTNLKPGRVLMETAYHEPKYAYSSKEIESFENHFHRLTEEARRLCLPILRHLWRARPKLNKT